MKVLAFDLETSGLLEDPNASILEMSYIIYDTLLKRDLYARSYLVNTLPQKKITDEITALTGLTNEIVKAEGVSLSFFCADFSNRIEDTNGIVMASNGLAFDIPMTQRAFKQIGAKFPTEKSVPSGLCCIDDFLDVPYPAHFKGRNLSHKAADHGFLNMRPHSGLSDVMSMIGIIEKGGYDWQLMLESAMSPVIEAVAHVDFLEKDKAKEAGFGWDPLRKSWVKKMRESQFKKSNFEFQCSFKYLL